MKDLDELNQQYWCYEEAGNVNSVVSVNFWWPLRSISFEAPRFLLDEEQ